MNNLLEAYINELEKVETAGRFEDFIHNKGFDGKKVTVIILQRVMM